MKCNIKFIKRVLRRLNKYFGLFKFIMCERLGLKLNLELKQKLEYDILMNRFDTVELELLKSFLINKEKSVFIDIGANIGFYSLYIAKECQNTSVYSFEPDEYNIQKFKKNIELNNLTNIQVLEFGIAEVNEVKEFTVKPDGRGSNSLVLPKKYRSKNDLTIKIKCKRLVDALKENNITEITCLKIDIEGYELPVLKDFFTQENKELFPKAIVLEEWGHMVKLNGESSIDLLIHNGYQLVYHKDSNFCFVLKD